MEDFYSITPDYARMLWHIPSATAKIKGGNGYESINGIVNFYQTKRGVLINIELVGMPYNESECAVNFHGFHIHEGSSCTGNEKDEFADVKTHYNPEMCKHPAHSGDLLPLISNKGYVWENFLIDTFTVKEIIGKTIVIHEKADDFRSQPSGDSGTKIACGEIR